MAMKYGEFKFDSKAGFTGSAGKKLIKAYLRGGPVRKAKGGQAKGKTIEDIIKETDSEGSYSAPEMTPEEEKRVKATADAERKRRQEEDRYDEDTEDMKENPMNKAKGGFAKMAGGARRGVEDQTVANMQRQKLNYAKGGMKVPKPKRVSIKNMMKSPSSGASSKMSSIAAPPSLASIAASRNPVMLMDKMKKGGMTKVGEVMHEYKAGKLHSGSKKGPTVKSRKQAIAIALSEARKGKK